MVGQNPALFYQKDIRFKVETKDAKGKFATVGEYRGAAVIPHGKGYKITVYPEGKADLLSVTSCHREIRTQDPDKKIFEKGYGFELEPIETLEVGRACPIELGVYEQKYGRNGWGFLAFTSKEYNLNAHTKCNGTVQVQAGVSVCQSRKGLIQEYQFDRPVDIVFEGLHCDINDGKPQGTLFTFLMPRGPCTVYFIDSKNADILHQANLYGYDEILLKE